MMPDITMCNLDGCPRAKQCHRHEAKVEFAPLQSWFYFENEEEAEEFMDNCTSYWPEKMVGQHITLVFEVFYACANTRTEYRGVFDDVDNAYQWVQANPSFGEYIYKQEEIR